MHLPLCRVATILLLCAMLSTMHFQSKKMEKLLAALNLPQVGEIRLVDPDDESYEEENDGSLFTIELNDRVYTMKVHVSRYRTFVLSFPLDTTGVGVVREDRRRGSTI